MGADNADQCNRGWTQIKQMDVETWIDRPCSLSDVQQFISQAKSSTHFLRPITSTHLPLSASICGCNYTLGVRFEACLREPVERSPAAVISRSIMS